jgi:hypothetical protein
LCRPVLAWRGSEYPNYIHGHGEYRRHDWNVAPFAAVLGSHKGSTVWSDLSNPWLADYISLVFGWDVRLVNIGSSRDFMELKIAKPIPKIPPEYVFVENKKGATLQGSLSAQNTELSLLRIDGSTLPILDIDNPNGMEGATNATFFWLGTGRATLTVLSPAGGRSLVSGRFTIGPSNPTLSAVDLTITPDDGRAPQHLRVPAGRQQFAIHTKPGLNHIGVQVENAAIRFLPSDPRPLLLRVDELRFERDTDEPPGALRR